LLVTIFFAIFGTIALGLIGYKLPGLEFNNQKVEAAFRKELVLAEDSVHRGELGVMNVGLAHVSRTSDGGFIASPSWVAVSYPNATTTTSDTVYQNNILGIYKPGSQALNGYVATIPTSLY
jgi:hypothetical protein